MSVAARPIMLPHLWKSAAASGVLAVALGVAVIVWTGTSITLAAILFGVALLLTGLVQVSFAFTLRTSTALRILLFFSGAAALGLGIIALLRLSDAWRLLAIWVAVGFIFRGVATTTSAISDPTLPGRAWNVFVGLVSLIAGVVVMASPYQSLRTLALIVGIWLIVIGVTELVSAWAIRRAAHASGPARTEVGPPEAAPTGA